MIIYKRTLLIVLICLTLLFIVYQLFFIIKPLLLLDPETKYVHLVNQFQILKMERLVLEEQYALASVKTKLSKLADGPQQITHHFALNNQDRQMSPNKLTLNLGKLHQEPVVLSLAEAKTFEQLEAYVSSNKPLQPQALTKDEKTVLDASQDDFTLQLMGVRDPNELKRYIEENHLEGARIIHTYYLNKDWYVLVFGLYKNHTEALKAIDTLPSDIKNQKPWIRQLSSLQKAIQIYRY